MIGQAVVRVPGEDLLKGLAAPAAGPLGINCLGARSRLRAVLVLHGRNVIGIGCLGPGNCRGLNQLLVKSPVSLRRHADEVPHGVIGAVRVVDDGAQGVDVYRALLVGVDILDRVPVVPYRRAVHEVTDQLAVVGHQIGIAADAEGLQLLQQGRLIQLLGRGEGTLALFKGGRNHKAVGSEGYVLHLPAVLVDDGLGVQGAVPDILQDALVQGDGLVHLLLVPGKPAVRAVVALLADHALQDRLLLLQPGLVVLVGPPFHLPVVAPAAVLGVVALLGHPGLAVICGVQLLAVLSAWCGPAPGGAGDVPPASPGRRGPGRAARRRRPGGCGYGATESAPPAAGTPPDTGPSAPCPSPQTAKPGRNRAGGRPAPGSPHTRE